MRYIRCIAFFRQCSCIELFVIDVFTTAIKQYNKREKERDWTSRIDSPKLLPVIIVRESFELEFLDSFLTSAGSSNFLSHLARIHDGSIPQTYSYSISELRWTRIRSLDTVCFLFSAVYIVIYDHVDIISHCRGNFQ